MSELCFYRIDHFGTHTSLMMNWSFGSQSSAFAAKRASTLINRVVELHEFRVSIFVFFVLLFGIWGVKLEGRDRVRFSVCPLWGLLTGNSGGRCLRWINYDSQTWDEDTCAFPVLCVCV